MDIRDASLEAHLRSLQLAVIMADAGMDVAAVLRRTEEVKQSTRAKLAQLEVQERYNDAYLELVKAQRAEQRVDRRLEEVLAENARYRKCCSFHSP